MNRTEIENLINKPINKPEPTHSRKWDNRFLDQAITISEWSKHSIGVGAVIAHGNIHVSQGINGLPSGADDSRIEGRHTIHAEVNAILYALKGGHSLKGSTLYCSKPPCSQCCAMIAQAGISRVIFAQASNEFNAKHGADAKEGAELLAECGVNYHERFEL